MCERMFHVKHSMKTEAADVETAARGRPFLADGKAWCVEVLALVDVTADGAQVELVVVGSVDVVVRRQVALGVHGLGQLGAGEHLHGLGVALFLSLLDEGRVHVGRLEDLALSAHDEVQVGLHALGLRGGRLLEVGLDFGDERVLEADVDLAAWANAAYLAEAPVSPPMAAFRFSSVVPTSQVPKPSMFVVFSAVGISERTFMGDTPSRLTFSSVHSY